MMRIKKYTWALLTVLVSLTARANEDLKILWEIGKSDHSPQGMALAPNAYQQFIAHDFGFEDRFFLIGYSDPTKEWPYVLPGPATKWGGTGPTAGIRSHVLNIDFELAHLHKADKFYFEANILQTDPLHAPVLKVTINGQAHHFQLKSSKGKAEPVGPFSNTDAQRIEISIPPNLLRNGFNEIQLTSLQGGWLVFDNLLLKGPSTVSLKSTNDALIRSVETADYEIEQASKRYQPLLIDISSLKGSPVLEVKLEGQSIFKRQLDSGRYIFEAPMPAVKQSKKSKYALFVNGQLKESGEVLRSAQSEASPATYVNTMMGAAHSRWMIAPGPWMPFSMVKLSPDNQNSGWQAGYDPTIESIGTFSHIHEWTMTGLGTFPTTGPLQIRIGDEHQPDSGYRSRIDKSTEKAPLGYYRVDLSDYDITAELTAGTRSSLQRYTYHRGDTGRVMVDLQIPSEYPYEIEEASLKQIAPNRIVGYSKQLSKSVWSGGVDQAYTVYFVMEFDQPIQQLGFWKDDQVLKQPELSTGHAKNAGMFVEFDLRKKHTVQVRTGISFVGLTQAEQNLMEEISKPFGWSFDKAVANQREVWNELLNRVHIESDDFFQKQRFYTNMYRSLASRNTFSDVDGSWVSADEKVRRFSDTSDRALGCDAFWNTFWNLNQFWNLITPEWSNKWVRSQLAMYDANGWLAKGPAGMEYIPVMVAEHEIPLIVGAYQMGIRNYDVEKAFKAAYKMQTTLSGPVEGGYAGNRDLATYLKHHYVPFDEGRFSNSLEYSYDDWTVGQFAKALGKEKEYQIFANRGSWWKNAIDTTTGYARMRDKNGNWLPDFDPFKSGANKHYVEGNAWQLTYFVPQDVTGLAQKIGEETFVKRLEWGFGESYRWRFNGPNDQYWDYPVVQGNQQSMHFAFLFNWVKRPWLTQKWSRAIMERYYGHGEANAYLGDEDQGQMSAWFVMNALGLFQTDGGTRVNPIYEIGSPIFKKVTVNLGGRFGRGQSFTIEAKNTSKRNIYIQKAYLNGKVWNDCWLPAAEVLKGGTLVLEMGSEPNQAWGISGIPLAD
ncbi:GH92 family glycosyl hydrolase [Olivibacter sp. LS-1]|uniref:GH92 family glycosyl hydrolase n=1 Tax=Olivibacter sp. LS-1 TaxID=2592345 RepID=UPI001FEE43BD|nr:GH92 family glycosyl hydrolase [Olivibacter sp. LS-1]